MTRQPLDERSEKELKAIELRIAAHVGLDAEQARALYAAYVKRGMRCSCEPVGQKLMPLPVNPELLNELPPDGDENE